MANSSSGGNQKNDAFKDFLSEVNVVPRIYCLICNNDYVITTLLSFKYLGQSDWEAWCGINERTTDWTVN